LVLNVQLITSCFSPTCDRRLNGKHRTRTAKSHNGRFGRLLKRWVSLAPSYTNFLRLKLFSMIFE